MDSINVLVDWVIDLIRVPRVYIDLLLCLELILLKNHTKLRSPSPEKRTGIMDPYLDKKRRNACEKEVPSTAKTTFS